MTRTPEPAKVSSKEVGDELLEQHVHVEQEGERPAAAGGEQVGDPEALDEVAGVRVGGPVVAVATVVGDLADELPPARLRSSCTRR